MPLLWRDRVACPIRNGKGKKILAVMWRTSYISDLCCWLTDQ
jgi:hypothetical protein